MDVFLSHPPLEYLIGFRRLALRVLVWGSKLERDSSGASGLRFQVTV